METPFHLNGKVILVTGASSGIGRQAAITCALMGATVVLMGRSETRLAETFGQLPGIDHGIFPCDLTNEAEVVDMVSKLPMLDGVVHCAGIVKPFPVQFLSNAKINETLLINFSATARLIAALFKEKKINDGASLVFLSSISATYPGKGNSMYAASKAGIEAFAKTVAAEYVHKKIRANCISPAMVKTPLYDYTSEGEFKSIMDKHVARYPLGVGYPEDVANTAVFLLSSASRWITGTNIFMDGGFIFSQ